MAPTARLLVLTTFLAGPAAAAEVWEGAYDCPGAQGRTGLTLTVEPGGSGEVTALFNFYADPAGTALPEGCFEMAGRLDPHSRRLDLQPGRWLLRPDGYVSTGLQAAASPDGTELSGSLDAPPTLCSPFTLRRVSRPRHPAALACRTGAAISQARELTPQPHLVTLAP